MSLYKRGKTWWIDYYYPPGRDGNRIRERVGPDKDEACILLSERLKDIRQGRNPELRRVPAVLFEAHAKECLEKHWSRKRSHRFAKMVIEAHLVPHFGKMLLTGTTAKDVTEYMHQRLDAGAKPATVNNERAVLSKLMTLAIRWGRLYENPVQKVERLEVLNRRERFITSGEADKLIEHAAKHLKPLLVAALETGGRLSELKALQWEDVDLARGVVYFDQTNTKSGKQRELPITPKLAAVLRERQKIRPINEAGRDYVFTFRGKCLGSVRTAFEKARGRADLGKDVTFHTLRHTFASWYMINGGDLYRLQQFLGHQDAKLTQRYAHLSKSHLMAGVEFIGAPREAAVKP